MVKILNISNKPTYDLDEVEIIKFLEDEKVLFIRTKNIFHFDKVYGTVTPRSRVIRDGKKESELVENVTTAVIDAGYYGCLHGKIKLTKTGVQLCKKISDFIELAEHFTGCMQIHMFQSIAGNYYDGTNNRPDLEPDIIFSL